VRVWRQHRSWQPAWAADGLPVNVTNEPLDWGGGHYTNIGSASAGSFSLSKIRRIALEEGVAAAGPATGSQHGALEDLPEGCRPDAGVACVITCCSRSPVRLALATADVSASVALVRSARRPRHSCDAGQAQLPSDFRLVPELPLPCSGDLESAANRP
jgi:hypothetical protein